MNDTTSSSVPATPVVRIEIFGSTVSVNGVVILHDGTSSLHQVAVQAAADRVAKALGRPVRAMATDSEGRASMIIHPDGRATDVELMDEPVAAPTAPIVPPPPPAAAAPAPVEPVAPTEALPVAAAAAPAFRPAPARTSGAAGGSAWPSRLVRSVGLAAALVAVVGMGVLLLGTRDDSGDDQAATDRSGETSPVASGASDEPTTTGAAAEAAPELRVTALPGAKALRLTIETTLFSSSTPPVASVRVELANGKVIERSVELTDSSTEVDLDRLAPGPATWTVAVAGAEEQTDQTTISDTFVAPSATPTPTAAPVAPPTTTDDGALAAAKAAERAAKQAARQAKAEARQAKAQAKAAQADDNDKNDKQTKKKADKPKSDFGRQEKKNKSGFGD